MIRLHSFFWNNIYYYIINIHYTVFFFKFAHDSGCPPKWHNEGTTWRNWNNVKIRFISQIIFTLKKGDRAPRAL